MQAMILAAGEGTRLRPLTTDVPKPMVPIVGRPLLAWTLDWLAGQGVTECVLNLYHRPQAIPDFFGETRAGIRLHYSFEDALRGTAGGVKAVAHHFQARPFFVIYGDNLVHADLPRLMDFHQTHGGAATLGLFRHPNPMAAGIVETDGSGRVTRFQEKPAAHEVFSQWASAGVYVLNPSVLDAIPDPSCPSDFGRDVFPKLLAANVPLYATPLGGYIQDTGTPNAYRQANWDALAGETGPQFPNPLCWVAPDAHIAPSARLQGRNIIGQGAFIGDNTHLTDCILWDGARVGAGCRLHSAILGQNASVEAGATLSPGMLIGGQPE